MLSSRSRVSIAKLLLQAGSVSVRFDEPFHFTRGIHSPVYVDCQSLLAMPDLRRRISAAFVKCARTTYPDAQAIVGTATNGVAWAAWLSRDLHLPLAYVYENEKSYGHRKKIEGILGGGIKAIIVEHVTATAEKAVNASQAIRTAGGQPLGVLAIFAHQLPEASDRLNKAGIRAEALTNLHTILKVAARSGHVSPETEEGIVRWAKDPVTWSKERGHKVITARQ